MKYFISKKHGELGFRYISIAALILVIGVIRLDAASVVCEKWMGVLGNGGVHEETCEQQPNTTCDCTDGGQTGYSGTPTCRIATSGVCALIGKQTGLCDYTACTPPQRYSCSGTNNACAPDPGGSFINDPTCGNSCSAPVRYACNGAGGCVANPAGSFVDDPTCGNSCSSTVRYSCSGSGSCVVNPAGSFVNDPTCGNSCGGGGPADVACSPANQTVTAGTPANFMGTNGTGNWSWSAPGGDPATGGNTSSFSSTYASAGSYTVTVNRGTSATCFVTVNPPALLANSEFVSQVVPPTTVAGQTYSVQITMRNTGTVPWTNDGNTPFCLGSWNDMDNRVWTAAARSCLAPGETVARNASRTFVFDIVAPTVPGSYMFQWRMVHEEGTYGWFGPPSNPLTIPVTPASGSTPPAFQSQPVDRSVVVGQTATFSVTATGTPAPTYQWRRNGADIPGANSSSFTTGPTTLADNGSTYSCFVQNSAGSATSNGASLTVSAIGTGTTPTIISQPGDRSVVAGQTATFSVTATGTPTPTYQWRKNGTSIPGATSETWTTGPTLLTDNGAAYSCLIQNSVGTATTRNALLTVTDNATAAAAVQLNNAAAYPVPYRPSLGHSVITFTNLGNDPSVAIKIFTIMGELVQELHNSGALSSLTWSVTNQDGEAVASGVYIYQIKNTVSEKRGKLVIIR